MKLQEQLQDRTGYSELSRNYNLTHSQDRLLCFAKKTADCFFFSCYTPQALLRHAGFSYSSLLYHVANTSQGMASTLVENDY